MSHNFVWNWYILEVCIKNRLVHLFLSFFFYFLQRLVDMNKVWRNYELWFPILPRHQYILHFWHNHWGRGKKWIKFFGKSWPNFYDKIIQIKWWVDLGWNIYNLIIFEVEKKDIKGRGFLLMAFFYQSCEAKFNKRIKLRNYFFLFLFLFYIKVSVLFLIFLATKS